MNDEPNRKLSLGRALAAVQRSLDAIPDQIAELRRKRSIKEPDRVARLADLQEGRAGLELAKRELLGLSKPGQTGDAPAWAEIVRRWRVLNGVTLAEMADALGLDPLELSSMERGALAITQSVAQSLADQIVGEVGPEPLSKKRRKRKAASNG